MKINEMLTESQLDELKCWTGYKRVPGVPAGAPDSCRKATSEETEQLDELKPKTLAKYKKAAGADARAADRAGDFERGNKRFSGIVRATKKEFDHDAKKHANKGVTESQTAKSGIVQTDVYGTKAYHAKCMESGCDWQSKRYDRLQQAQAAAKKHAEQHFDKKGVAEAKPSKESTYWRVEQSEATGRYHVVTGYQKRKVWTNKLGANDFVSKDSAQKKADELNQKQGVAEGTGDTKTQVVGKYKGWRFEIETQTEDDRYVKYYGAVSPEGKWHSLPKRATADQFKQFVDSKGVNEGDVPAQYLSGTEKVDNISPVLTKPYGSAKQTKLMKNFFGSS